MNIRKGMKVSHSIYGGLWKVLTRETPNSVFKNCTRFTLVNIDTHKILSGVRDKDVILKNNPLFNEFVTLGETNV